MSNKSVVVISTLVDATVKEYQPDVDFKMFRTIDSLDDFLDRNPIRADILFFTRDVTAGTTSAFAYLKDILAGNDFIKVDRVIYITEEGSRELSALKYLIDECHLDNWEIVLGSLSRAFVTEVINGTFREDIFSVKRKAVIRRPRADYIKEQLKNHPSLEEEYVDDEKSLSDIDDMEIPSLEIVESKDVIKKVFIAGINSKERTAFSVIAAQYLSRSDKVILLESDPEYHLVTEFITKSRIRCSVVTVTEIYNDANLALEKIRKSSENLVVIQCIDRIKFNYQYLISLLYHNLMHDFTYIIDEVCLEEMPDDCPVTIVTPSTITDVLATGERIDKSAVKNCRFVGVDLGYLPEVHVSSGIVLGSILNDILTCTNVICPVVEISSLRLDNTPYDLGGILGKGVLL